MGVVDDLFNALLFGSGAWFGLLLIIGVCFVVAYSVKYSGVFFSLLMVILGMEYLTQISNEDYLNVWFFFISVGTSAFTFLMFLEDVNKRK